MPIPDERPPSDERIDGPELNGTAAEYRSGLGRAVEKG
jgi:hypothetical protein